MTGSGWTLALPNGATSLLLGDCTTQSVIQSDPALKTAVERRDLPAILGSRQFLTMLEDAELRQVVVGHWDTLQDILGDVTPAELPQPQQ